MKQTVMKQSATAASIRHRLALAVAVLALAPVVVAAQGGSSLFAVGESGGKSATRASVVKPQKPVVSPKASSRSTSQTSAKAASSQKRKTASKSSSKRRIASVGTGTEMAMNGRWHDNECIPLTGVTQNPPLYVKRLYEFDGKRKAWRMDANVFTSDSCLGTTRLLSYHGEGSYDVTGKSKVAANAYDAVFEISRWQATPATREGVLSLLNARCGSGDFEEGRTLDLSVTGCPSLGIRAIAARPSEFELVRVAAGKFHLGSRSFLPGLPDDRPTQISSYGMVRVSQ